MTDLPQPEVAEVETKIEPPVEESTALTKEDIAWLKEQRQKTTSSPTETVEKIAVLQVPEPETESEETTVEIEVEKPEKKTSPKSNRKSSKKKFRLLKVNR